MTSDQSVRAIMINVAVYAIAGAFLIWAAIEAGEIIVNYWIGRE